MNTNTKLLIDECLTPELATIAKDEFSIYAIHVPWLGKPPRGLKSWKDPDIVQKIAEDNFALVTNNRRDFVDKYFRQAGLDLHDGLIIILERINLDSECRSFRAVMQYAMKMDSTVNKLIQIDAEGNITAADWPDLDAADPWRDPFK